MRKSVNKLKMQQTGVGEILNAFVYVRIRMDYFDANCNSIYQLHQSIQQQKTQVCVFWGGELDFVHDELKRWLRRYLDEVEGIDALTARRDALLFARTTSLDGMPHGKGGRVDPTGNAAALIEGLNAEISQKITEARAVYDEIDGTIEQIKGRGSADMRCCLQCRYLDGCSWPEVAQILFGRNPDFEEKFDNYLRRTHFAHAKALEALSKLVPDFAIQEMGQDRKGQENDITMEGQREN